MNDRFLANLGFLESVYIGGVLSWYLSILLIGQVLDSTLAPYLSNSIYLHELGLLGGVSLAMIYWPARELNRRRFFDSFIPLGSLALIGVALIMNGWTATLLTGNVFGRVMLGLIIIVLFTSAYFMIFEKITKKLSV